MIHGILKEIAKTVVNGSLLLGEEVSGSGFLYHYSKEQYPELLSRRAQDIVTAEELEDDKDGSKFRGDQGLDCESLSLFLEPIPADIIAGVFNNKNKHWKSGSTLVEHKVKISDIKDCEWAATSTPYQLSLIDYIPWPDDDEFKKKYFALKHQMLQLVGDESDNMEDLKKCQKRYKGFTRKMYEEVPNREDLADITKQYAGAVVHIIMYPIDGKLPVHSTKKITLK